MRQELIMEIAAEMAEIATKSFCNATGIPFEDRNGAGLYDEAQDYFNALYEEMKNKLQDIL